jgi:hypothetical protein
MGIICRREKTRVYPNSDKKGETILEAGGRRQEATGNMQQARSRAIVWTLFYALGITLYQGDIG